MSASLKLKVTDSKPQNQHPTAVSALTLMAVRKEDHSACKTWSVVVVICLD